MVQGLRGWEVGVVAFSSVRSAASCVSIKTYCCFLPDPKFAMGREGPEGTGDLECVRNCVVEFVRQDIAISVSLLDSHFVLAFTRT